MQWTGDRNAGFSRADVHALYAPLVADPVYGYQAVNVEAQERVPGSLLNWMKRLIRVRRAHPVFGRGSLEFLHPENRRVLAYLREKGKLENSVVLVGFGDPKQDTERSALLSKLRAMAVRRELAKGGVTFREITGLGDALPVAANNGEEGRIKNRRVEVWVY
jgi:phosphate transport system substrate-binding protein